MQDILQQDKGWQKVSLQGNERIVGSQNCVDKYSWREQIRKNEITDPRKKPLQRYLILKRVHVPFIYDYNQLLQALTVHINNGSPYIQNYSNLIEHRKINTFDLFCEPYRFTLNDLMLIILQRKRKNIEPHKIPREFINLVVKSILQAYKYILYILQDQKNRTKKLEYCICAKKIIITQDYTIKLAYPCIENQPLPSTDNDANKMLLLKPNVISTNLRKNIAYLVKRLTAENQSNEYQQINKIFFDIVQEKSVSIVDEMENIRAWNDKLGLKETNININDEQSLIFMMSVEKQIHKPFCHWNQFKDKKLQNWLGQQALRLPNNELNNSETHSHP